LRAIVDTSVLIADEQGRRLDTERIPAETALSVVTLAELELGVHLARDERQREQRLATLLSARQTYAALPVDERVASAFAHIVAAARRQGLRPLAQDVWIAATARVHDAVVCAQDADFDDMPGVEVVRV
jgi:predicted nucleic acid-binding protein